MKFSIIIPSFNAAAYIEATLMSVERQRHPNAEIIVVDGGSNDGTQARVRQFAERFPNTPINLVSEHDKGQLDAVQKGCALATGDILHWLNADDIMMPGALNVVEGCFNDEPEIELIFSDNFAFDELRSELYVGPTIRDLTYNDHVLFYRQMYSECIYWRRSCLTYLPQDYFDLRLYTDYAFFSNLRRGLKERWVPKRLGAFRIHSQQISSRLQSERSTEFFWVRQRIYRANGWTPGRVAFLRLIHGPEFFFCQIIRPMSERIWRRLVRYATFDRKRKHMTDLFFTRWINPFVEGDGETIERLLYR